MSAETIGYKPETATKKVDFAKMPKPRNTESKVDTEIKIIKLTPFDQRFSQWPDDLVEAIAIKMALKGISAESINS